MSAHPRIFRSRRSQRAGRRFLQAALVGITLVAATLSALSFADLRTTHAWFTAEQEVADNSVEAAVVKVGGVGPALTPDAPVSVTGVLPLSPVDATDPAKGARIDLTVRNTGSVPITWTLSLTDSTSTGSVDLAAITNVSYSVAGGPWSTPQKLASLTPASGANLSPVDGANTAVVTMRFWFDSDATNAAQGARARFTTLLSAIQTGAS